MPDRSTRTLFCASTRTWRASRGESRSIGVPPPEFRASRNSLTPLTTKAFTVGAGMFLSLCQAWDGTWWGRPILAADRDRRQAPPFGDRTSVPERDRQLRLARVDH